MGIYGPCPEQVGNIVMGPALAPRVGVALGFQFPRQIAEADVGPVETLETHNMVFAAEKARLTGKVQEVK